MSRAVGHSRTTSRQILSNVTNQALEGPLNNDSAEKEHRMAQRQERDNKTRNKFPASIPPRKLGTKSRSGRENSSSAPGTPESGSPSMDRRASGAMNKVPLLSNFEEWIKMATDNKINASNSWNFALIDYFHDMTLLRDGDSINFQKASCTLDGCVKIYTSRVDSVATETGRLLTGLSDNQADKPDHEDQGEADEDEEEDDEGKPKKSKKRGRAEATLVKDFSALEIKKFDLELAVDPLFKKTSADFDEGGAKGLLLNHLFLDVEGRIIFDASDAIIDSDKAPIIEMDEQDNIDLEVFRAKYFPDIENIDYEDICPSMKNYDVNSAHAHEIPFMYNDEFDDEENDEGAGYGIADNVLGGMDEMSPALDAFGDGGEAWMKNMAEHGGAGNMSGQFEPFKAIESDGLGFAISEGGESVFSYFDRTLSKNWAGPEHWKIQRFKKDNSSSNEPKKPRKEKEHFEINFFAEDVDEDDLFAKGGPSLLMPKTRWISRSRNLLPNDTHFSSQQLLRLFLKPKAILQSKKRLAPGQQQAVSDVKADEYNIDERYWEKGRRSHESEPGSLMSPVLGQAHAAELGEIPQSAGVGFQYSPLNTEERGQMDVFDDNDASDEEQSESILSETDFARISSNMRLLRPRVPSNRPSSFVARPSLLGALEYRLGHDMHAQDSQRQRHLHVYHSSQAGHLRSKEGLFSSNIRSSSQENHPHLVPPFLPRSHSAPEVPALDLHSQTISGTSPGFVPDYRNLEPPEIRLPISPIESEAHSEPPEIEVSNTFPQIADRISKGKKAMVIEHLSFWRRFLFPTTIGFRDQRALQKIASIFAIPTVFVLTATIPVLEYDDPEPVVSNILNLSSSTLSQHEGDLDAVPIENRTPTWNRRLHALQLICDPMFLSLLLFKDEGFPLVPFLLSAVGGISAAAVLALFTRKDHSTPVYRIVFCVLGFAMSIAWISAIADEVVGVLRAFGVILNLSDAILGVTVFAMGNSLSDFVADVTVARMGYPMMALSACFGGPMLSIGISGVILLLGNKKHRDSIDVRVSKTLIFSTVGLLTVLVLLLIGLRVTKWRMTRAMGFCLLLIFTIVMIANVLVEILRS